MPPPPGAIRHLVVLMLENRSFDHMLGFMKSDAYPIDGLNGNESNLDPVGVPITVSKDADFSGDLVVDPGHHFPSSSTATLAFAPEPALYGRWKVSGDACAKLGRASRRLLYTIRSREGKMEILA